MFGIFGDKPWFKSLTAWGVVLFAAGSAGIGEACGSAGLLSEGLCGSLNGFLTAFGSILAALGLRRAVNV